MPVNTRTAYQTTILPVGGGSDGQSPVLVRRGENVAYCIYAMHRRKDLYGHDAEDFRPERWEEQNLPLYHNSVSAAWDTYHSVVVQEFVLVVSQHGRKFEEYFPDC